MALLVSFLIFKDFILGKEPDTFNYEIKESWALPSILKEISGMSHLDENRLLCIQDEDGYLFDYNLKTSKIEQQIKFAGGGDYESISIVKDTVYVLRSDGKLFEVQDVFKDVKVNTYTFLNHSKYNFEGMYFDSSKNRLLMAPKYKIDKYSNVKPIFGFDLSKKKFIDKPIFEIKLDHPLLENHPEFMPSSLTHHPTKSEYFMLDGRHRRLLILDSMFTPKQIYKLNLSELPQPESLSFYGDKLYISTEADRGITQHIYEIELK